MEMEEAVMVTSLFPNVNLHKEKQAVFADNVNKQPCAAPTPPPKTPTPLMTIRAIVRRRLTCNRSTLVPTNEALLCLNKTRVFQTLNEHNRRQKEKRRLGYRQGEIFSLEGASLLCIVGSYPPTALCFCSLRSPPFHRTCPLWLR